ncbi:MAG: rRNA maturation RNase YbeY [Treponema sp.]|jgi:probable rRNA maturation factor|nr:rRNA maturation RNase YbeY [Treponema sp.]
MNRVFVNAQEIPLPVWSASICEYAVKVLNEIKRDNWELSVLLCGDKTITELNARYRDKPEATDILSFRLGETIEDGDASVYLPGDIVISLDTLRENAQYFQIPQDEELRRLLIHGILHLDGMDHGTNDKTEPMLILQEEILNSLKGEHIFAGAEEKNETSL